MASIFQYCNLNVDQALDNLHSHPTSGISTHQAKQYQRKFGYNEINSNSVNPIQIFLRQFKSSFVYLLLGASVLAFFLGEKLDSIIIVVFITINALLGFVQEYRSEHTVALLKKYMSGLVQVRRDNKDKSIESRELVPGDIIILSTGDISPADVRLINHQGLIVDESIMTGESNDVTKTIDVISKPVDKIFQARNLIFKGTSIKSGKALALVIATGKNTQLGTITKLVQETHSVSAFEQNINHFSQFILRLVLGTLVIMVVLHLLIKPETTSFTDLIIFSIALAVGVIPEALPLVTTFALSRGAKRLAQHKVVVKRLSAIEDLGSIDVLCTDKTGTITQNDLTVNQAFLIEDDLMLYGAYGISNFDDTKQLPNNSFDIAILKHLKDTEKKTLYKSKILSEIPFDPDRRRNSLVIKSGLEQPFLVVRGAPEIIVSHCKNITQDKRNEINKWIEARGQEGNRCLAVALRPDTSPSLHTQDIELNNLKLAGIIAFHDPLKPSTISSIQSAHKLGVSVKIITGDGPQVAGAVGFAAGVIDSPALVCVGSEFEKLSSIQKQKAVEKNNVFARIMPQQKYEIIQLLQNNHQVGYLGEGINDAPALKIANVALVVKGASDIAQDAADIILLERNLKVIINGIEEGRQTFTNTIKYIKATLLSNFGNFYAVALASLMIDYLPMLPIQILLVNLLSDFPMISISTDNVEQDELRNPKSYDVKEIILVATLLGLVSTFFDFVLFGTFHKFSAPILQTNWFIGSIITELILLYSIRTRKVFYKASRLPSYPLMILTTLAIIITLVLPYTNVGQTVFHFQPPTFNHLIIIFAIIIAYFITTETVKLLYYKYIAPHTNILFPTPKAN